MARRIKLTIGAIPEVQPIVIDKMLSITYGVFPFAPDDYFIVEAPLNPFNSPLPPNGVDGFGLNLPALTRVIGAYALVNTAPIGNDWVIRLYTNGSDSRVELRVPVGLLAASWAGDPLILSPLNSLAWHIDPGSSILSGAGTVGLIYTLP